MEAAAVSCGNRGRERAGEERKENGKGERGRRGRHWPAVEVLAGGEAPVADECRVARTGGEGAERRRCREARARGSCGRAAAALARFGPGAGRGEVGALGRRHGALGLAAGRREATCRARIGPGHGGGGDKWRRWSGAALNPRRRGGWLRQEAGEGV